MAPPYLSVTPTGGTELVLVSGATDLGYSIDAEQTNLGDVVYEQAEGAPVGTLGATVVGIVPANRSAVLAVNVYGASADEFAQRLAVLEEYAGDLRDRGGVVTYRKTGQSTPLRTSLRVLAAQWTVATWGNRAERVNRATVLLALTCAPYAEGDCAAWEDDFADDGIAAGRWTVLSGSTPTIGSGSLRPGSTSEARLLAVGPGYVYGDVEVAFYYKPAGTTSITVGAILRARDGAEDSYHLRANVDQGGTLRIQKVVAGVVTTLTSVAGTALAANGLYWLRARVVGNVVTLDWYNRSTFQTDYPPNDQAGGATTTLSHVLSAADAGRHYSGRVGLQIDPNATTDVVRSWRVAPTIRGASMPDVVPLRLAPAGSAGARVDLDALHSGGSVPWGLVAWAAHDEPNICPNGNFVQSSSRPWSAAAFSGLTNAATSVTLGNNGRYETGKLTVVTPGGSVDQGASCPLGQRLLAGRFYVATAWLLASPATTTARLRLGNASGNGSGTAVALSTSWKLYSTIYQPASDATLPGVAATIATTTAQTFDLDAVCVCETIPVTLAADPGAGGTSITLDGVVPDEWPAVPFLAILEPGAAANELVTVTAATPGSATITVLRGVDGTTAAAHAAGTLICPLPSRERYEGGGGPAPFGSFDASSVAVAAGSSMTRTTVGSAVQGAYASVTAAGAGSSTLCVPVDASVFPPDAADSDVGIEVYAIVRADTGLVDLTVTAAAGQYNAPTLGRLSYSAEFGSLGVRLPATSVDDATLVVFAGTLRLSRATEGFVFVTFAWGVGSTETLDVDEIILVPVRSRAAAIESPPSDAATYWGWASQPTRRVNADLTGIETDGDRFFVWRNDVRRAASSPPLGGAPIETPAAARVRWMVWADGPPNLPTAPTLNAGAGAAPNRAPVVRFYPTPRWGRLRDA